MEISKKISLIEKCSELSDEEKEEIIDDLEVLNVAKPYIRKGEDFLCIFETQLKNNTKNYIKISEWLKKDKERNKEN